MVSWWFNIKAHAGHEERQSGLWSTACLTGHTSSTTCTDRRFPLYFSHFLCLLIHTHARTLQSRVDLLNLALGCDGKEWLKRQRLSLDRQTINWSINKTSICYSAVVNHSVVQPLPPSRRIPPPSHFDAHKKTARWWLIAEVSLTWIL